MVEMEGDVDEDGGDGGGFPPLPFKLSSSPFLLSNVPFPCGGLEPSPTLSAVNESNIILTILLMSTQLLLKFLTLQSKILEVEFEPFQVQLRVEH